VFWLAVWLLHPYNAINIIMNITIVINFFSIFLSLRADPTDNGAAETSVAAGVGGLYPVIIIGPGAASSPASNKPAYRYHCYLFECLLMDLLFDTRNAY
jgi:hypothetical protein